MPNYNNLNFTPSDGYSSKETYETRPTSETRVREIFNALPEQIKAYLNQQIVAKLNAEYDLLRSVNGAASIGVSPLAAGYENKLQPVLARLKTEINTAVLGQLPNGSVTMEKLASEIIMKLNNIEATLAKLQPIYGTWSGDGAESHTFNLGYTPSCVIYSSQSFGPATSIAYNSGGSGGDYVDGVNRYGGIALRDFPAGLPNSPLVEIITNGFKVYGNKTHVGNAANRANMNFCYIIFK